MDAESEGLLPTPHRPRITSYFDPNNGDHQYEEDAVDDEEEGEEGDDDDDNDDDDDDDDDNVDDGEDGGDLRTPLLPIFSAAHLDRLPLYNITHSIRLLILQRCETTLSWDQLRSPQISQFLVKPIERQIRTNHFNRATIFALIANGLQFQKEGQLNAGNVGVLTTRALLSELLAIRLLKEFTTRELIDALSYDFDPLQGRSPPATSAGANLRTSGWATPALYPDPHSPRAKPARVSTIEISIRAQAKRFLAHPLVVQHLEAIWAGSIVFHSEADNLHRMSLDSDASVTPGRQGGYGTLGDYVSSAFPADRILSRKTRHSRVNKRPAADQHFARRSVTLYDPRDASLFKLSRLRVPRYRQVFTTVSFAAMLALFLAVLIERSLDITTLEVVFWFWSAGYMLDEIVGFSEQGFGLYILSFWNAFDLGILLLFVAYYCLRLYGLLLVDEGKRQIANNAYDLLATTAVLLFPRLFSVLDHYRYFSQLLIAFRIMAQDLVAVLALILISCSGFFVAFTLSFANDGTDGNSVAYALFQILMGFTPAAWDRWDGLSVLGKCTMTVFLLNCHFLIVTLLISVLTNSFMSIISNGNEEHQFLFAVNTISLVKSDALFSYIPPTNIVEWMLSPLRHVMPFRRYVRLNRSTIKVSHFLILLLIFCYERVVLARLGQASGGVVEGQDFDKKRPRTMSMRKPADLFSPGRGLREPSVISFHKDQALDEVFRRPYLGSTVRTTTREMDVRRNSATAVDRWIETAEHEGASPPMEQPRSVLERLEHRRASMRRAATAADTARVWPKRSREFSAMSRSMVSEPDLRSTVAPRRPHRIEEEEVEAGDGALPQDTDADGDDENNLESEVAGPAIGESATSIFDKENQTPRTDQTDEHEGGEEEYFQTPQAIKSPTAMPSSTPTRLRDSPDIVVTNSSPRHVKPHAPRRGHHCNVSAGTTLFAAVQPNEESSSSNNGARATTARHANTNSGTASPARGLANLLSGTRTPKLVPAKARPIMPPRQRTAPGSVAGMAFWDMATARARQPSSQARALDLASEIGDNKWVQMSAGISGMPNSFSEQLLRERELQRQHEEQRRRGEQEEKELVNRILLSRMQTLEEGFREVIKEVKELSRSTAPSSRHDSSDVDFPVLMQQRRQERIAAETGKEVVLGKGKKMAGRRHHQRRRTREDLGSASPRTTTAAGAEANAASPDTVLSVGRDMPTTMLPAGRAGSVERAESE